MWTKNGIVEQRRYRFLFFGRKIIERGPNRLTTSSYLEPEPQLKRIETKRATSNLFYFEEMELKPKLFKLLLLNRNQKSLCTSQEPPNTGNTHMPRKQSTVYTWPYIHLRLQIRHKLTSSDRPIIRLRTHYMCQMPNGIEIIDDSQKCITDLMSDPKVFPNAVIHHQTTITKHSNTITSPPGILQIFQAVQQFPTQS